jgi:hypothetical protein
MYHISGYNGSQYPVGQQPAARPDPLADAIAEIQMIVARYPELTYSGFGVSDGRNLSPAEREEKFRLDRLAMFKPSSLLDFLKARDWLRDQPVRYTLNRMGTSYELKHIAEHDIGYCPHGLFIAAAVSAELQVERAGPGSPNAFFSIAQSAWRYRRDGRA